MPNSNMESVDDLPSPTNNSIKTKCPACGFTTLFIGNGGYLTCSNLECPIPNYDRALERREERLNQRAEEHETMALIDELNWALTNDKQAIKDRIAELEDDLNEMNQENTNG